MNFDINPIILDLNTNFLFPQRLKKLIERVRILFNCEAIALLQLQLNELKPLVQHGLMEDIYGRRFLLEEHPRLAAIGQSKYFMRFDHQCDLPDPYDGMLLSHKGDLPVHSCMGFPIYNNEKLAAILTLDSMRIKAFEQFSNVQLIQASALINASFKMGLLSESSENHASHSQQIISELNKDVLFKSGCELIGTSIPMRALRTEIAMVAKSEFNVLIQGETGVGKELVAGMLHQQSARNSGPLVYVNCAAIPENLVESELFGHVKGAFTGADKDRAGKFSLADNGTLLLDEIGELPLSAQSKLLRVLQNQEIQRVGKDEIEQVNVRVLAATNRDLEIEIAQGRFRADLYHRIGVYPIKVPPLRVRLDDIQLLAGYFVENVRRKLGIQQLLIGTETIDKLERYVWPGNVRELQHVISRASLRAKNSASSAIVRILPDHIENLLIDETPSSNMTTYSVEHETFIDLRAETDNFQKKLISKALIEHKFNWSGAARQLHTDRSNLVRLCKRLNIKIEKQIKDEQ